MSFEEKPRKPVCVSLTFTPAANEKTNFVMLLPIFVLSHEPDELQKTADAGADIDFSGHTHDGQLFPGNLTIGLFWENPCGMIKKDNMYSIVTSGVGVYGTFMRVGTDAEICSVDIDFAG